MLPVLSLICENDLLSDTTEAPISGCEDSLSTNLIIAGLVCSYEQIDASIRISRMQSARIICVNLIKISRIKRSKISISKQFGRLVSQLYVVHIELFHSNRLK